MSEYNMTHTGKELDDAINKVRSGYISSEGVVRHDIEQSLTDSEKARARSNVNALSPEDDIDASTLDGKRIVFSKDEAPTVNDTNVLTIVY